MLLRRFSIGVSIAERVVQCEQSAETEVMGRDIRYIPQDSLQHVVDVVFQNRFLLSPSPLINERYLGVLGRAQTKLGMKICAVVVMSNHYHLLLRPRDGKHLADFMCFLKTNLAKEIGGRLRGWKGHFFGGRFHATTVSNEEAAQVRVLRYVLGHGPKEHLVDSVRQWPGVHCASSLIDGNPMKGRWYDRTAQYGARVLRGEETVDPENYASDEEVTLSPLPCWEHLPDVDWRRAVEEMISDIDLAAARERMTLGKSSLGVSKVLTQDPDCRPDRVETSPKPRFHAFDRAVFNEMLGIWRAVVEAFYEAAAALRFGKRGVEFPQGTFPPSLPFVPFARMAVASRGDPR